MNILITQLLNLLGIKGGGLLPHVHDERDYRYEMLFGTLLGYTPKNRKVLIQPLSCKNQTPFNNCTFMSATGQKEIDEGVVLSPRYITAKAKAEGLISGNGFCSLRGAQDMIQKYGICEEQYAPYMADWIGYVSNDTFTYDAEMNAASHRSKLYFSVSSKSEYMKALDDGKVIQSGLDWHTTYNSYTGGLLPVGTGISVGGHAVYVIGYEIDYNRYIIQNSFGSAWGINGMFYVDMDKWHQIAYTGYVQVDEDSVNFAQMYEMKDIKGSDAAIYRVENGKKRVYLTAASFLKLGKFNPKTWIQVSNQVINSIPTGDPMPL